MAVSSSQAKKEAKDAGSRSAGKSFVLSATLLHGSGTRDIAVESSTRIAVAEASTGSVRIWERKDDVWKRVEMTRGSERMHNGLCTVVSEVSDAKDYEKGTFVSGGGDYKAVVFRADGTRVGELKGHTNTVCSVAIRANGMVLTGCWDGAAREFAGGQLVHTYARHKNSAVVLGLSTGEVVTAGGEGDVRVYGADRTLVKRIPRAHGHVVRKAVAHPLGFATCANDGMVKVWSSAGECLATFEAYGRGGDQTGFVYGLTVLPSGELVTCDDGNNVKVWQPNGSQIQSIPHPATVRAVAALPNGDFVTAGSDGMARVFSRDGSRFASEQEVKAFDQASAGEGQPIDVAGLPTEADLMKPGERDGAVRIFNVQGKAMVYRWSADAMKWILVGQAMSRASKPKPQKTMLDGKAYDHVSTVFITEQHSVKLGWNVDDDPIEVVNNFAALYNLGPDLKTQVYNFVAPKTDPQACAARKERERRERIARAMKHCPSYEKFGFHTFSDTGKLAAMRKRIEGSAARAGITEGQKREALDKMLDNVAATSMYHASNFSRDEANVAVQLLNSLDGKDVLPVLDLFRVLMMHASACAALQANQAVRAALLKRLNDPAATKHALMLTLRVLANLVARRPRSEGERKRTGAPPALKAFVGSAVRAAAVRCADSKAAPAVVVANAVFMSNVVCWMGMTGETDVPVTRSISDALLSTLQLQQTKPGALYYAAVGIGSASILCAQTKAYVATKLGTALLAVSTSADKPTLEAIEDVKKIFSS